MKLAFCLFRYYPYGGLERDFLRIAVECQQRGYSIEVYAMAWDGEVPRGITVTLITPQGLTNHARCHSFIKQLKPRLQSQLYDLVVGFNRMPGLDVYYAADVCYAASARAKHGWWYRLLPRYRSFKTLEKAVFAPPSPTQILLLAQAQQQLFMQHYGTPAQRFHLLPPGIDHHRLLATSKEEQSAVRQEFNIAPEQYLLLMVGSDFKRKGADRALLGIAALPEALRCKVKLLIIGAGHAKPLVQLARKLGIQQQVEFLGARNDVGRFMLAADLLLHPAYIETAGMVLLEALVSGLPVLVTENCGYAFHIQQAGAGCIVPMPFTQEIFNNTLLSMLNPQQREVWSNNAKAYAQKIDLYSLPERAVDLLEQFYQQKIAS